MFKGKDTMNFKAYFYATLGLLLMFACFGATWFVLFEGFDRLQANGKLAAAIVGLVALHLGAFNCAVILKSKIRASLGMI
jgi:hypothetical protein